MSTASSVAAARGAKVVICASTGNTSASAAAYATKAGMACAVLLPDAKIAMATQFCFEAAPVIAWVNRLQAEGVTLPVHIGVAGPAKLQTLIKFAIACGVGPSLRVLQKRALDVTKLLLPYEPTDVIAELAAHKAANPGFGIEQVHFFPLGGIKTNAEWVTANGGASGKPAKAA